jgi:NitT/TauT family transport system substrate-binding protein
MEMKHFKKSALSLASLALMSALMASAAYAQELTKITIRLAFIPGGIDAPFFVAKSKGYFEAEGLDVTILDGTGSTDTIQAVGNGSVQMGNAGLGALAQAAAQAKFDNITAVFGLVQKDPTSIISLKGSGITKPKDLEGKRFATEAGNLTDGMIGAFAAVNGIDMDTVKITITDNDRQALLKGDVDFINGWANPDGDKVAAFHEIEPPMLFADYGVNLLGSSVIVRKDWLAEHGDAVKGYLRALTKGHDDVLANPDEALELFMQNRPDADKEAIKQEIAVMEKYRHTALTEGKPFGYVDPADVKQTIDLLETYAGIPKGWSTPEMVYTDAYLPSAM